MRYSTLNSSTGHQAPIGAASFLVPARIDEPELLEQGVGTQADVRANLHEMWRINRYLGGLAALTSQLFPLLRSVASQDSPLRLVDIGTGSGTVARHVSRWAQRNHMALSVYGLDISARNLQYATETTHDSTVHLLQSDVNALPFANNSVDYYISSLFLHHFVPADVINILQQTYHNARRGIVMNDLVRGYLPMIGFRLITPVFARNFLTRHDGVLSVRRAYTPAELQQMASAAGIPDARVVRTFPWRMTLVAEKPDA